MKFGRLKLKVRKIFFSNAPIVNPKYKSSKTFKAELSSKKEEINNNLCRICYTSSLDGPDPSPLISPCNCTGSLKYVHLRCLQQWLMQKVQITKNAKNSCIKYTLNPVQCEICKTFLPDFYKKDGILYEICEFHTNYKSYISLETILSGKYQTKVIYVINLEADNGVIYTIGREHNCDICVNDITISRLHAGLLVNNNKIYLRDERAKFGTSVLVQNKRFSLFGNKGITFQFGRSIITMVQRSSLLQNLFSCCCSSEEKRKYWDENKKGIDFEKDYEIKCEDSKSIESGDTDPLGINQKGGTGFVEIEGINMENELDIQNKRNELFFAD